MKQITVLFLLFTFTSLSQPIEWKELSADVLAQAKAENKIIMLNLKANWCHWCHVMDDSTYANSEVQAYIAEYFIPVKADQDANPELSARYKEYGWPATIFINGDGEDVVKRAGYISPESFLRLLKAIVADPSPEYGTPDFTNLITSNSSDSTVLKDLQSAFENALDYKDGGFDQDQKFIENDTYEYALFSSKDPKVKKWITTSVNGAKQLCDPAWGGVYQYSTHDDWEHLHFEKLLSIQTRYLRIFNYYQLYNEDQPSAQQNIDGIMNYVNRFLKQDNGLFSNAQDADLVQGEHAEEYFKLSDKERVKLGIPAIDSNTYTENNAQLAFSLIKLSYTNENSDYLKVSEEITSALLQRKADNNLFYHASSKRSVWSLKDQIGMALLLTENLKLNEENIEMKKTLGELLDAIAKLFITENGSAKSFVGVNGLPAKPLIEENIQLASIFNWYAHFSKEQRYTDLAQNIYNYLVHPKVAEEYYSQPALLMLAKELGEAPLEFNFLQNTNDSNLGAQAKAYAPFYSLFATYSKNNLPKEKQELFGSFDVNVLFACTASYCSSPMYANNEVAAFFKK